MSTLKSAYIFYHKGESEKLVGGVGFLIYKNNIQPIVSIKSILNCVIFLILRGIIKTLQIYASAIDHNDQEIVRFDEDID